jgi:hypothetical protein
LQEPRPKTTKNKESWKNTSTTTTTNDCSNEPTPKIARSKESWKNALTTTTRKLQRSRRGERIHYAFNALSKVARFCTQASS